MPKQPKTHNPYKSEYQPPTKGKERARKIRSSYRWQKVRKITMGQRPLCEGCGRAAEQVHHIEPLHTHPHLAFVDSNLSPVCTGCHAKIERGEVVTLVRGWVTAFGPNPPEKWGQRGSDEEVAGRKFDV